MRSGLRAEDAESLSALAFLAVGWIWHAGFMGRERQNSIARLLCAYRLPGVPGAGAIQVHSCQEGGQVSQEGGRCVACTLCADTESGTGAGYLAYLGLVQYGLIKPRKAGRSARKVEAKKEANSDEWLKGTYYNQVRLP